MNKTELKLKLLETFPACVECGAKLKVSIPSVHGQTNEAIVRNNVLICYQCHRIHLKREEIERLPFLKRWKKKIDLATGIFTVWRRFRISCNQFYYFKIKKGKPTSRLPIWLRPN
jgi:hypothetical protein